MSRLGTRYVTGKVAGALGSLAFMLVFNFFLFRVLPGDPVRTLARNRLVSEKQMDELTRTLGLDQPLPQQFLTYLQNTVTGELGLSFKYRVPVAELNAYEMRHPLMRTLARRMAALSREDLDHDGHADGAPK